MGFKSTNADSSHGSSVIASVNRWSFFFAHKSLSTEQHVMQCYNLAFSMEEIA